MMMSTIVKMRDFTREEIDELHVIFRKAEESKKWKNMLL